MWFYRFIYWVMMTSRWYQIWSRTYRFLFQRKYTQDTDPIVKTTNFGQLQKDLDTIYYHSDTFRVLWDVCFSPHYLQHILNTIKKKGYQPTGSFDCDDFACLAVNTLDSAYKPMLMGISYKRRNHLSFKGHMICVFQLSDGSYCHMGNWGLYFGYTSLLDIAKDIADLRDSDLVGYTLLTKDLSLKQKIFI